MTDQRTLPVVEHGNAAQLGLDRVELLGLAFDVSVQLIHRATDDVEMVESCQILNCDDLVLD